MWSRADSTSLPSAGLSWGLLSFVPSRVSQLRDSSVGIMTDDFFNDSVGPFLSSITKEITKIADSIEEHSTTAASFLRETLNSSPWLPESIKPPPPPPVASKVPPGYLGASQDWILRNRAVTAAVIAFVGTGVFIIWRRRRLDQTKRRAKRAKNGAKTEVVVLAGSPHTPLTRSLSLDLERRGFIVYIPVSSVSENQLVQSEARADIRPLDLDITTVCRFPFYPPRLQ